MPKVSVIIACHNSSAYLDEAIRSVLSQTLDDLELLLVDDCSADNTLEIAMRYQLKDDRITVISLPKKTGPAAARNAGIRAAKGEWLGILDSDDVAMPTRFEEQMNLANSGQDLVLIASSTISIDKDGFKIKEHKYPTDHKALIRSLYTLQAFPSHSSMVYRSNVVEKLIGFNSRYASGEDYDLWLRLSAEGKLASLDKPLVKIRRHEQNISHSEGGRLGVRFGVVAVTCHFLRIHGYPDPSTSNDEKTWQKFVAWIDGQILGQGIYERREAWTNARAEYFTGANQLSAVFRFATCLLQSGQTVLLILEKIFGSSLPKRLAQEWMKQARTRHFSKTAPDTLSPKISIILPAYNEEHDIGRALESILAQTFTDWELIVIDDGSTDATTDLVRRYAEKDSRINLVCNETHLSLSWSLNKGIWLAKSDLIARVDADDINLPERLSKQYEYLQAHHEIDVLGTGAYLLSGTGQRVSSFSLPLTHAELERLPFDKIQFFHPSVMIRRRFFNMAGLYDRRYPNAEDKELWLRGLRVGCCYANMPEMLIEYSTDEYVKSWRSIISRTLSSWRIAKDYKIKFGYTQALFFSAYLVAIKLKIYKPRSLRIH